MRLRKEGYAPVGYVWFEIQALPETPFDFPRARIYVHHISVTPEARRRGVATTLMRFVEKRAISEGIDDVILDTWHPTATLSISSARWDIPPSTLSFAKGSNPGGFGRRARS